MSAIILRLTSLELNLERVAPRRILGEYPTADAIIDELHSLTAVIAGRTQSRQLGRAQVPNMRVKGTRSLAKI
jgi:hypothetical protein